MTSAETVPKPRTDSIFAYQSPLGQLTFCCSTLGQLTALHFAGTSDSCRPQTTPTAQARSCADQVTDWLNRYFAGARPQADELPLKLSGSAFNLEVWQEILKIGYGQIMTYGDLAQILTKRRNGTQMAAQAVGSAAGRNPITIIIPCHRLIGTGGRLSGYSAGVHRKLALLKHEGHSFAGGKLSLLIP